MCSRPIWLGVWVIRCGSSSPCRNPRDLTKQVIRYGQNDGAAILLELERAGTGIAMSEQPSPYRPNPALKRVERGFESLIFNSRWLMAPFYFGLVISLGVLLLKFCMVLWEFIVHAPGSKESDIILGVLSLIDISLTGNLILIVVFSGYENFVSKIDPGGHPDWPDWMTKVNFGGLKQKLLASIVAISAIQVLKAFMNLDAVFDPSKLAWLVGVHLAFVVSAFMLAISDRWSSGDQGGE